MKRLNKLGIDSADAYDACINGIDDPALAERFKAARAEVIATFKEYDLLASRHELFSLKSSNWGQDTQQVLGGMTKKEFVDLYSTHMVDKMPGRTYYDRLMMLAPLGKCPFCGFGQVSTLDHFLSKSRYPAVSVLCSNLIPSCTDCNKGKGAPVVTRDTQILHPYFEEGIIETEPWLFAEVIESAPATIRYFVQSPDSWPKQLTQRVTNSFHDLNLAQRFGVEAATELSELGELLDELGTKEIRQAHLSTVARVERKNRKNSWKAALYEALAKSAWFVGDGYRKPAEQIQAPA
jgi:hypothetical protein